MAEWTGPALQPGSKAKVTNEQHNNLRPLPVITEEIAYLEIRDGSEVMILDGSVTHGQVRFWVVRVLNGAYIISRDASGRERFADAKNAVGWMAETTLRGRQILQAL